MFFAHSQSDQVYPARQIVSSHRWGHIGWRMSVEPVSSGGGALHHKRANSITDTHGARNHQVDDVHCVGEKKSSSPTLSFRSLLLHTVLAFVLHDLPSHALPLGTLGARASGNRWEHVGNIERTGTIYLTCFHQAHFMHIYDVPGTFSIHWG